ncbi:hypothetical protein BV898_03490 [Hypsibius exemplaris]|uniref:Chitin-binding type-2 domain-containing protein n=1 Tax=Hypsibius exemplaris TaxID=2072580 RepID=A0A1W0X5A2_HYPEX|nr:hypothetical protein BV898_03490 [Hypsibius exemplaris]
MTAFRACGLLVLSLCCWNYAAAAALGATAGSQDAAQTPAQNGHQAAASSVAEQPVAAESSYGSYGHSYAPKPKAYSAPSYSAPSYDSYNNDYQQPYVTGSCYGQYPGMTGNVDYDCKTYSVCQADGRLDVLYCPPYTRFNNYLGVCDWHFKVDSYCQPLYKEEPYYQPAYKSSYGSSYEKPYEKTYEKPAYDSYAPKQTYGYEKSYNSYSAPTYSNYEEPSYYGPVKSSYAGSSYEAPPSYGHRSVYPSSKKY